MKIDVNKVGTALVIAFFIAAAATVWDFQNIKASVKAQDNKIDMMYVDIKEIKNDVKSILRGK